MDYSLPRSSVHGISQEEYGVSIHFLFQGIFLTQASNLGLLHCRQILDCLIRCRMEEKNGVIFEGDREYVADSSSQLKDCWCLTNNTFKSNSFLKMLSKIILAAGLHLRGSDLIPLAITMQNTTGYIHINQSPGSFENWKPVSTLRPHPELSCLTAHPCMYISCPTKWGAPHRPGSYLIWYPAASLILSRKLK